MSIKNNIQQITDTLPPACRLIAVSKTHPAERVLEAYEAGHRLFGENKVQEMTDKWEVLPKDIQWHLIGHLQSNKVKYIAPYVALIHSVDSFKLLEEINKQGKKINRVIPCLLQVFIATEETKYGLSEEELHQLLSSTALPPLSFVKIEGLMGMASLTDNHDQIQSEFKKLKGIFDHLKGSTLPPNVEMKELSMGMSADYPLAVAQGSTLVRVGTAIFGHRNYQNQQTI